MSSSTGAPIGCSLGRVRDHPGRPAVWPLPPLEPSAHLDVETGGAGREHVTAGPLRPRPRHSRYPGSWSRLSARVRREGPRCVSCGITGDVLVEGGGGGGGGG